jgi:hypothetical protein
MASEKTIAPEAAGMIIDGVAGSEAVDSSGEVLSIKGADVSELEEGRGLFCYEHKGHEGDSNGQEIVGKILSAKKIYKASDCETDRQKLFWDKTRLPFIYIIGRLYDAAGHEGSKALASAIRDHIANKEPVILGFSVEGSTIRKVDNVLKETAIRRVAVTNKACNKTAVLGVLADPQAPVGFEKYPEGKPDLAGMARKNEDPLMMRLGGSEMEYSVDMLKAMTAGSYAGAPGTLTGGAALQVEDRGLGARAMKAFGAWDRKKPLRQFLKTQLPEVSDDFLDHFSDLVENHLTRVKKTVEVVTDLAKANKAPKKQQNLPALEKEEGLTVLGQPVKPNPKLKVPKFDEKSGTLHTPKGSFKVYIPGKDTPEAKASFDKLMQDPKISQFHDYAMENWSKAHKLLKAGQLPPEVAMHSVLFSNLSPNTPVPVQELMYSHLVDSMEGTSSNPLTADPTQMDSLRRDWLNRDSPAQFPEHSRQHFHRLEKVLRLKRDSKKTGKKKGDISSYMLANDKFKNMSEYRNVHGHLMDMLSRHKADGRNAAAEMMRHKHQAGLWDDRRQTALASGKEDPGAYPHGSSFPGLAPKTSRYALGMMGAGNQIVPDTHFVRYLFGLDKRKDSQSIKHLKELLWNPLNSQTLEGLDRYFAKHHDSVEHMVSHPKWGSTFENREDAVFPAFWKTWMGIVPHEKSRGLTSGGFNELTDHKPFWEAVAPHLQKSEEHDLPMRTAIQHADWAQQYGAMAAQQLYFRYLLPQLLDAGLKRKVNELVQKFDNLGVELRALEKAEPQEGRPTVRFQDKDIGPGAARVNGDDYQLLSASPSEFIGIPREKAHTLGNHKPEDLVRIPRNHQNLNVYSYPEDLTEKNVVDVEKHGVGEYNHHPETKALVHGLDFGGPQQPLNDPSTYVKGKFWTKNAEGKRVLMKPSPEGARGFTEARREGLYHNLAKDFFGMGQYLPRVGVVRHPQTGQEFAAIEEAPGTHYNWARSGDPERHKHLKALGDSGELDKMALMNMITGNSDRHNYNWLMPEDGKLKLIDHGLAFDYPSGSKPSYMSWYHGTNGDDFGDDEDVGKLLHPAAKEWAMGLKPEELDQQMRRHGVPEANIEAAVTRLKALHQHLKLNPATTAYSAYHHPQVVAEAGADSGVQVQKPWTSGTGSVTLSDGDKL